MSLLKSWVIPGVVAICAVTGISLYSETEKMESDLTARSTALLQEKGMDWASISFSGRDGTLTGIAPEEGESSWAVELLDATWGIRTVDDQTELLAEQKPYTWGLERSGDKLSMIGYLPYKLAKTTPDQMSGLYDSVEFTSSVEAARGAPQDIDNAVTLAADLIKDLPNAKIMLIDDKLSISGQLQDGNEADVALFASIKERIASADLGEIGLELQIPEPKAPEPEPVVEAAEASGAPQVDVGNGFAIKRTAEGVDINGVVPSDKVKESILTLAKRKFGFGGVTDNLAVKEGGEIAGIAPQDYAKLTEAALQAVSRLGEGEAIFGEGGLVLKGGAFYEAALGQLQEKLKAALPEGLAFTPSLSVAAPGAPVGSDECQTLLRGALEKNTILFDSGKASISADSFGLLDGLIYTAHRCPDSRIQIAGHTDSDGDDASNQTLSEKRAGSVVSYLVAAGLSDARLEAKGFGETQPVADNGTPEGKAKNRRIEFVILAQ